MHSLFYRIKLPYTIAKPFHCSKGSAALVFNIRALAAHEGVEEDLLQEWKISKPKLQGECDRSAASMPVKVDKYSIQTYMPPTPYMSTFNT